MRSDPKPFNYRVSFYVECTDVELVKIKDHFKQLIKFHFLKALWTERVTDDECPFDRKIHYIVFGLQKTSMSQTLSTSWLRKLFEADLVLFQQSFLVHDLEFLSIDQIEM